MPGVWGWKELWWMADCGCMGYGKLLLKACEPPKWRVEIDLGIDLEKEQYGAYKLNPLSFDKKAQLLKEFQREFELAVLSREVLTVLREIGKLTNGVK